MGLNNRPLIFLDFDGVINNHSTRWTKGSFPPKRVTCEPELVALVTEMLERLNARLVISSTWRKIKTRNDILWQFPQWAPFLEPAWKTGNSQSGFRGDEVDDWIQENEFNGRYICVDDDGDFYEHNTLVKINPETGIKQDDVEKIVGLLM